VPAGRRTPAVELEGGQIRSQGHGARSARRQGGTPVDPTRNSSEATGFGTKP
jgi:hypothetical protein